MIIFLWVFGILLIFVAIVLYCVAPGRVTLEAKKSAKIFYGLNCAHRGLHSLNNHIPENSLPAFAAARDAGYGVELDVQFSKDGKVVVFHDNDLMRACGVSSLVSELNWNELSVLSLFGTEEKIPLFTDVLEVLGDTPVIVEIKSAGTDNAKLCRAVLDILRVQGKNWCVESFDPRAMAWFKKNAPDVLRGQLSCLPHEYSKTSKLNAFLLAYLLLNYFSRPHFIAYSTSPRPFIVDLCRMLAFMNVIWTVTPESDIKKCELENDIVIFENYRPETRFKHEQ